MVLYQRISTFWINTNRMHGRLFFVNKTEDRRVDFYERVGVKGCFTHQIVHQSFSQILTLYRTVPAGA